MRNLKSSYRFKTIFWLGPDYGEDDSGDYVAFSLVVAVTYLAANDTRRLLVVREVKKFSSMSEANLWLEVTGEPAFFRKCHYVVGDVFSIDELAVKGSEDREAFLDFIERIEPEAIEETSE